MGMQLRSWVWKEDYTGKRRKGEVDRGSRILKKLEILDECGELQEFGSLEHNVCWESRQSQD